LVVDEGDKNDSEKEILLNTTLDILRNLRIDLDKADDMEVDDTGFSDEIKDKLKDRLGDTLADLVLKQPDVKSIVRGLFFGEINI